MRNVCHMEPNPVGPWLTFDFALCKAGSRSRDELAHFACAVNGGRGVTEPATAQARTQAAGLASAGRAGFGDGDGTCPRASPRGYTHQQIDAARDGQAGGPQDGGKQEASRH